MTKRYFWVTASALLVASVFTGCAQAVTPKPTPVLESSAPVNEILTRELPPEITAYGVVLAALYIATGDAEAAIASGKVTPDEVYEAKQAIEDDTLDFWRQRAEAEIKGLTN